MTTPIWRPLGSRKVKAKPDNGALWNLVYEYLAGPRRLRFKAQGDWKRCPDRVCGPNGDIREKFEADNLSGSAPVGALIGKIGGSSADKGDATQVFVVGDHCVIHVSDTARGGLYLTMNDHPANFQHHDGELEVTIEEAP